jgi:hypothetical protein
MTNEEIEQKQDVLDALKRRLHEREIQAAKYGVSADPVIKIEIDDLRKEIAQLQVELSVHQKGNPLDTNHTENSSPRTNSNLRFSQIAIVGMLLVGLLSLINILRPQPEQSTGLHQTLSPTSPSISVGVQSVTTSAKDLITAQQTTPPTNTTIPTVIVTTTPLSTIAIPTMTEGAVADFSGMWMTNIALLNVTQTGAKVVVVVQGYGGNWNSFMEGSIEGKMVRFNKSDLLDEVIIKLSDDGKSFTSTNPDFAFCGVHSGPLPSGCGFSGKWNIRASGSLIPANSYAILVQVGSKVEGTIYKRPINGIIDRITGDIEWGKGWSLNGKGSDKLPAFFWGMQSNERGFEGYSSEGNISWDGQRVSSMPSEIPIIVNGRVVDSDGKPISGIDIAVYQHDVDIRGKTGEDGTFSVSLSPESTGQWNINIVDIDCTSRIMDANCNISDYVGLKTDESIILPQKQEVIFVYEKATTWISGKILDEKGQPISKRVRAERSDGADSWVNSSKTGDFKLPITPGTWEVFAVDYNPYRESKRMQINVEPNASPLPIIIISP